MPFAPHIRVTAIGRLGTPEADRFSYGFCIAPDNGFIALGDWHGITALQATDLCDSVRDFHARAATTIDSSAVLEMVKMAHIGADGKYDDDPIHRDYSTPGGTGPNVMVLPQTALAISLGTARRGPSGKGRFYIPMPGDAVDAGGGFKMSTALQDQIRGSAQTMLTDVNNWPGADVVSAAWKIVVASTKGYNTKVTGVRVGAIIDTMRSRRNKLDESYNAYVGVG